MVITSPCQQTLLLHSPITVTGSIGIFGLWFNLTKFLENKIGITHDVVKTGEFADIYTVTRQLNSYERQIIQTKVEEGYEIFTSKVSENRGMSQKDVKAIAGGRVWSGEQAVENGLVDILGGFDDAVKMAAKKAGIEDDYSVRYYPKQKPFIEQFFDRMSSTVKAKLFNTTLDPVLTQFNKIKNLQGLQARMGGDLEIR